MLQKALVLTFGLVVIFVVILAGVIAFDCPTAPPSLTAGNSIPGIEKWNFAELPKQQSIKARDSATLNYRYYPGRPDRIVVLVHGSTGSGAEMHRLAQRLQAAGASVYAIALRGHGGSGPRNGDVSYIGQLDDDLTDFIQGLGLIKPGVRRTLVGFSLGGGFALRIAGGRLSFLFDDYLAISPYIAQDAPTNKADNGGWTGLAMPRIVALSLLDALGMPWFQELPVVHFATTAKPNEYRTPIYSFRLISSLQLGRDWRAAIAQISAPVRIVVGAKDELFSANRFRPMIQSINSRIAVTVVQKQGHLSMISDADAINALAAEWQDLSDK